VLLCGFTEGVTGTSLSAHACSMEEVEGRLGFVRRAPRCWEGRSDGGERGLVSEGEERLFCEGKAVSEVEERVCM